MSFNTVHLYDTVIAGVGSTYFCQFSELDGNDYSELIRDAPIIGP